MSIIKNDIPILEYDADAEHYDERSWGGDSTSYALELCIEAVLNI